MNLADVKAELLLAYQSGVTPEFMGVLNDGEDEAWRLGNVTLALPVIPALAPPDLEYALRLRRETFMSGSCPNCGATVAIQLLHQDDPEFVVATSLFAHSIRCPARDEACLEALRAYKAGRDAADADELLQEAVVATRDKTGVPIELRIEADNPDVRTLAEALLDEAIRSGSRCPHLSKDPMQTAHVLLAEAAWRCDECQLRFANDVLTKGLRLPGDEEFRCDLCGELDPDIQPLLFRIDLFIMRGGTCHNCLARWVVAEEVSDGRDRA